jgi:predicted NBD/HSP70 family sugar kinase
MSRKRQLTINDISKELNLSIPAVTSNMKELLKENIIKDAGHLDSFEGRKPALFEYNPNYRFSIGVELKEEYIKIIITNMDSKKVEEYYKNIEPSTPEEIVELLMNALDNFFISSSKEFNKIAGIGISIHGYINNEDYSVRIFFKSKLYTLSLKPIYDRFNVPIFMQNNITSAAIAEVLLGSSKNKNNIVYLYVNNGVGAGIIVNNEIHRGHDKIAGAIGHMTIDLNGRHCRCGNKGCWETYINKNNLIDEYNSKSEVVILSLHDFFKKLDIEDPIAVDVFKTYVYHFEVGLKSIILMYNPNQIILGGFLVDYFSYLKNFLSKNLFSKDSGIVIKKINISKSKLGDNASILGASLIPIQNIYNF